MKSNQFWALAWLIVAFNNEPPWHAEYGGLWMLGELSVAAYFYWSAIKAGEFQ